MESKNLLSCLLATSLCFAVWQTQAQQTDIVWQKTFGDSLLHEFPMGNILTLPNGDHVLMAYQNQYPQKSQVSICRLSPNFDSIRWKKAFELRYNFSLGWTFHYNQGNALLSNDGQSLFFNLGVILMKTDLAGNVAWSKHLSGGYSMGNFLLEHSTDNVLTLIQNGSNYLKFNANNGSPLSASAFRNSPNNFFGAVKGLKLGANKWLLAGKLDSFVTVMTVLNDAIQSTVQYKWVDGENALLKITDVEQDANGNFYYLGFIHKGYRGGWLVLMKTNAAGDVLWAKNYEHNYAEGWDLTLLPDGLLIGGWIQTFGNNLHGDALILKTDWDGTIKWTRRHGSGWYDGINCLKPIFENNKLKKIIAYEHSTYVLDTASQPKTKLHITQMDAFGRAGCNTTVETGSFFTRPMTIQKLSVTCSKNAFTAFNDTATVRTVDWKSGSKAALICLDSTQCLPPKAKFLVGSPDCQAVVGNRPSVLRWQKTGKFYQVRIESYYYNRWELGWQSGCLSDTAVVPNYKFDQSNFYRIVLRSTNSTGCNSVDCWSEDIAYIFVPAQITADSPSIVCRGNDVTLRVNAVGMSVKWTRNTTLLTNSYHAIITNEAATYAAEIPYITPALGCPVVTLHPTPLKIGESERPVFDLVPRPINGCQDSILRINIVGGTASTRFSAIGAGASVVGRTLIYQPPQAGYPTVIVRGADSTGLCITERWVSLPVYELRNMTVSIQAISGCPTSRLYLSATTTNTGSNPVFEWFYENETTRFAVGNYITVNNMRNGRIYVRVTVGADACVRQRVVNSSVVTVACVPTSEASDTLKMQIAPNLASNSLRVSFEGAHTEGGKMLKIFNAFGQQVLQMQTNDNTLDWDITHLSNGIYTLQTTWIGRQRQTTQRFSVVK